MTLKHRFKLIKNNDHHTTQPAPAEPVGGVCHAEITKLFQDYNEPLIRYLTIRLRSRQDADEVAQEAYIRLLRRDHLDDIDCFQSFLFRTATNISIDLQRQRTRQNNNYEQSKNLFQSTDDITPERDLRGRQKLTALKTAVEKLPPKCREAFMLYKFNHMEYTDIALEMGLSTSSIRKYITRALAFCVREVNK